MAETPKQVGMEAGHLDHGSRAGLFHLCPQDCMAVSRSKQAAETIPRVHSGKAGAGVRVPQLDRGVGRREKQRVVGGERSRPDVCPVPRLLQPLNRLLGHLGLEAASLR